MKWSILILGKGYYAVELGSAEFIHTDILSKNKTSKGCENKMIDATEAHEQASSNALMRQKAMFETYPHYIKDQIVKIETAVELAIDEGYFHCSFDTAPLSEADIQKIMDYLSFWHFSLKLTRGKSYEAYDAKWCSFVLYNNYTIVISW